MIPIRPWLLLDMHYLCHRAWHVASNGGVEWKGNPTGVIFSVLKTIGALADRFQTDRLAFCFDHQDSWRKSIFPAYKANRKKTDDPAVASFIEQVVKLRTRHLKRAGFRNVFCFSGMEGDDIIAAIAKRLPENQFAVMVTADKDLYQMIGHRVAFFNPQKNEVLDRSRFVGKFGIRPRQWARVKAIAGCPSDEIPGIAGVGEATAIRYIRGELQPHTKAYQSIRAGSQVIKRNRVLVQLPFFDCPSPGLRKDRVTKERWRAVCQELGMRSIAGRPPIYTR